MQLQKELKREKNARVTVRVTVDKSSVNESMDEIVHDLEKRSKIPGFRRGRVPKDLVLTHFSKYIKEETIGRVLAKSLQQVIGEENERPISEPVVVEMGDLIKDQDFSFRAEFDVMPEFVLPEYKGIASDKYVYKVRDEDVTREIENLRDRFATLVSKEGKAEDGDYLVLDHAEYDKNDTLKTKKLDQTVYLDMKNDPLSKQLIGMAKGEEKSISLPIEKTLIEKTPQGEDPEEHQEDQATGEPGELYVLVKDVKRKELPVLNDEFARDISDVETLEDLKKKIREEMEKEAAQRSEEKTKEDLITKLVEKTNIELPQTLVNGEISQLMANIATAYRVDQKKLFSDEAKVQKYKKSLTPRALRNVKYELIMNEIVKKESIEATDEDVDEEIRKYAKISKRDFQSVKSGMTQNRSIDQLKVRLRQNKALNLVYQSARLEKTRQLHLDEQGGNE